MGQYIQRKQADREKAAATGKHVASVVVGGTKSPPRSPDMDSDVMMIQSCQEEPIYFLYTDYEGLDPDHNEALVVMLDVAENEVQRILVDNGSLVNIIFEHFLNPMKLGYLCMDSCSEDSRYEFVHYMIPIQDIIYLSVIFRTSPKQISHIIKFYVTNSSSSYNMNFGRPTLTEFWAITSTIHLKVKFPTWKELEKLKVTEK